MKLPTAGLSPSFKSHLAERIIGSRDIVARLRSGPALELYYEAGDPHSQLCAALARRLLPRLAVPFHIRLVPAPDPAMYMEERRQRGFAARDAARLAPCYSLPAPVALTDSQRTALESRLAAADSAAAFLAAEEEALRAPDRIPAGADRARTTALLAANAARRRRLHHYLPAMWQYRGEWFWALDRLEFLRGRLEADAGLRTPGPLAELHPERLPETAPRDAPLEFWFSFRSPYSYLAAVELLRRRQSGAMAHVQVRPVLPMVMRGLPVPTAKRLYIVRDVKRCADARCIPFGRVHDPVGPGALRLLTVFPYEADLDAQLRYCAIACQTAWSEGLDVCRDDVLRSIFERSGLDWLAAQARLAHGIDTRRAEANREALFAAGLWGVPSFRQGPFTTWGQDRLWMLDQLAPR